MKKLYYDLMDELKWREIDGDTTPVWKFVIEHFLFTIRQWWAEMMCRRFGHDMTTDAVYPEDGGEELHCTRCGFSVTCWH
jgi:hypothetical protein